MDQFIQIRSDQTRMNGIGLTSRSELTRRPQMSHATFREQLCPRINEL